MAKAVKKNYLEFESDFLEKKLFELMNYIQSRPFEELKDRIEWKQTRAGGLMPMVVATIEAQRKDLTSAMKEYAEISILLKDIRKEQDYEKQSSARGQSQIPWSMRQRES